MEKEKSIEKDLNYPVDLWIATLLLGSLFCALSGIFINFNRDAIRIISDTIGMFLFILSFSFIFSLPVLILVWGIYRGLVVFLNNIFIVKLITILLSIISVYTLQVVLLFDCFDIKGLSIPFTLAILTSGILIQIRKNRRAKRIITTQPV